MNVPLCQAPTQILRRTAHEKASSKMGRVNCGPRDNRRRESSWLSWPFCSAPSARSAGAGTAYVTAGESPYDEVGIELNSRAPPPAARLGIARASQSAFRVACRPTAAEAAIDGGLRTPLPMVIPRAL